MIKYFKNIVFAIFNPTFFISNYNASITHLKKEKEDLLKEIDSLDFKHERKAFELKEQLYDIQLSISAENEKYYANDSKYQSTIKTLETEKDCLTDRLTSKNNEIKRLSSLVDSLIKVKVPDVKVLK